MAQELVPGIFGEKLQAVFSIYYDCLKLSTPPEVRDATPESAFRLTVGLEMEICAALAYKVLDRNPKQVVEVACGQAIPMLTLLALGYEGEWDAFDTNERQLAGARQLADVLGIEDKFRNQNLYEWTPTEGDLVIAKYLQGPIEADLGLEREVIRKTMEQGCDLAMIPFPSRDHGRMAQLRCQLYGMMFEDAGYTTETHILSEDGTPLLLATK